MTAKDAATKVPDVRGEPQKEAAFLRAMRLITNNIIKNIEHLRENQDVVIRFVKAIEKAAKEGRNVFVVGSGRSAMVGQMFQTRLEHLDIPVFFVTNSRSVPHMQKGDLLIVVSGSGRTPIVKAIIESYLDQHPQILSITSYPDSWVGRMSDLVVPLIGRTKIDVMRRAKGEEASLTPEGTQFEIASAVFLDGVVAELAQRLGKTDKDMAARHSQST